MIVKLLKVSEVNMDNSIKFVYEFAKDPKVMVKDSETVYDAILFQFVTDDRLTEYVVGRHYEFHPTIANPIMDFVPKVAGVNLVGASR